MPLFDTQSTSYKYGLDVDISLPKYDIPSLEPDVAGAGGGAGMGALMVAGAVSNIIQTLGNVYVQKEHARAQKVISDSNERIAKMLAEDAKKRGHEAVARFRMKGKKIHGAQRAYLAAQGIRLDMGSAQDIQQETMDIIELEALTIKNNAAREALGFKVKAIDFSLQGQFIEIGGRAKRIDAYLSGSLRTLDYYRRWRSR